MRRRIQLEQPDPPKRRKPKALPPQKQRRVVGGKRLYQTNALGSEAERGKRRLRVLRPQTRADCLDMPRPCPYVGCRYHLALDVLLVHGEPGVSFNHPVQVDDDPPELWIPDLKAMPATCVLDVVDGQTGTGDGQEMIPTSIAKLLGYSVNLVKELEEQALPKLTTFARVIRQSSEYEVEEETTDESEDMLDVADVRF